ncbi:MAG: hypothetical protein RLZZ175_328 [Bacteroidota bacterium]|jgi:phosphopantothenoylcysteine decarboxylase/phosphopantothenate--cysteine ligase
MQGKKILLGVSGSIAAYKSAVLVRELIKAGAEVKVIMTDSATAFIGKVTMANLSKNEVISDFTSENGTWHNHVDLGLWADAFIIAPATANTIAKMANGISDNFLIATYLSARCKVFVAPAMDVDMYKHPAFLQNIDTLNRHNCTIIESNFGELASGLIGDGRMAEPHEIVEKLSAFFLADSLKFKLGFTALITAGPTRENLDPVRFLSNYSTGKMGYALAEALAEKGAKVFLISGPVQLNAKHKNINLVNINSANEMLHACEKVIDTVDLAIFAAAVADFAPAEVHSQKIKKQEGENEFVLKLIKNPDIAATLGSKKKSNQVFIGFALETNNELENAKKKLISKNFDAVLLNSASVEGAGFGVDTNVITFISKSTEISFPLMSKQKLANELIQFFIKNFSFNEN